MPNNSLIKYKKENIFGKIFNKIKMFFTKRDVANDIGVILDLKEKKSIPNKGKNSFATNIIITNTINNNDINQKRKELMENLSKNPKLLEGFSTDRLEKILQWYKEENDKKRVSLGKPTSKDKKQAQKEFMKKLSDNPKLLNKFSYDRLEKILVWYKRENMQKIRVLANKQ